MASDLQNLSLMQERGISGTLSGSDVFTLPEAQQNEEIERLRQQQEEIISSTTLTPPIPPPPTPTPLNAFLAQFSANLGSMLMRNPNLANQVMGQINRQFEQAQAIETKNFLTRVTEDRATQDELKAFRIKVLDDKIRKLIDAGEPEKAADVAAARERAVQQIRLEFKQRELEEVTKPEIEARTAGSIERVRASGEEARKTKTTPPAGKPGVGGASGKGGAGASGEIPAGTYFARRNAIIDDLRTAVDTNNFKESRQGIRDLIDLSLTPQKGDTKEEINDRVSRAILEVPGGPVSLEAAMQDPDLRKELIRAYRIIQRRFPGPPFFSP